MPDLLKDTAQKSTDTSRYALEIERKRMAHKTFNAQFAALARNKPEPMPDHPVHLLSGNLPTFPPAPSKATKADPLANAPEHIRRLAQRHGPEAGRLLLLIEQRSNEEKGSPINFSTDEAASVMGVSRERAEHILTSLLQSGTLTPRSGPFGNRAGFVLT